MKRKNSKINAELPPINNKWRTVNSLRAPLVHSVNTQPSRKRRRQVAIKLTLPSSFQNLLYMVIPSAQSPNRTQSKFSSCLALCAKKSLFLLRSRTKATRFARAEYKHLRNPKRRKSTKDFLFLSPMQLPTKKQ